MSGRNTQRPVVVTTAPESPAVQRRHRERQYMIMMGFRMACFLLIFVVPNVWKIVMVAAAVVLPGIAVVLANAVDRRRQTAVPVAAPTDAPALSDGLVLEYDEPVDHRPHSGGNDPDDRNRADRRLGDEPGGRP